MGEFVFRNLSVKLFPERDVAQAVAQEPVCVCCTYAYECADCSLCTDRTDTPCSPCTDTPSVDPCPPCTAGMTDPLPECGADSCLQGSGCFDTVPAVVHEDRSAGPRAPDVIAAEIEALRAELRLAIGLPAVELQVRVADELPAGRPAELLRGVLLDAVGELDEGRSDG